MIKLQLLLRHPSTEPAIDAALQADLEALGLEVTGYGRATVSAQITPEAFTGLFGTAPDLSALPVPASLADRITLITSAPQHCATTASSKGKNAAI
jgi:hypothetical protein